MKRRRIFDVTAHSLFERRTSAGGRRLAHVLSNSCLLLGAVAAIAGLAHVVLKQLPASDCASAHSRMLARLEVVAFYLSVAVIVLAVGALVARTGQKGRAGLGMALAIAAATAVFGGYVCSVSTP
jgi:hypothetical protein